MGKRILIVGDWGSTEQVYEGLQRICDEGHTLISFSDENFIPIRPVYAEMHTFDFTDYTLAQNYIRDNNIRFDAVMSTCCELVPPLVALLAQEYGCIGNTPHSAFLCRSKYHMRQQLQKAGIPQPPFSLCKSYGEVKQAIATIGAPCVVKPVGGHSSFGAFFVGPDTNPAELQKQYETSRDYMFGHSVRDIKQINRISTEEFRSMGIAEEVDMVLDFLVEGFLDGHEISVDALVQDGNVLVTGIADQERMPLPYFVQVSERMPYLCGAEEEMHIHTLVHDTVHAVGVTNSPVHVEIMLTANGPRIVEIACRMGSDNIHDSVYKTTGIHLMEEAARIAMGEKITAKPERNGHYAMQYILPEQSGVFERIDIPQELRDDPDVTEIEVTAKPGESVSPPPDFFDFLGYIGVRGDSPEDADAKLTDAFGQIRVRYREDGTGSLNPDMMQSSV